MLSDIFVYGTLLSMLLCVIIGAMKISFMSTPLRIFYALLCLASLSELIAFMVIELGGSKAPIWHAYNVIELALTLLFFVFTVKRKAGKRLITLCIALPVIAGVCNTVFFQPLNTYNTNMLVFECIVITSLSLYAVYHIITHDLIYTSQESAVFQIWLSQMVYWSGSFFFWAFLKILKNDMLHIYSYIEVAQTLLNLLLYAYIAWNYAKLKPIIKQNVSVARTTTF
jgi:hypothetical protein